MTPSPNDVSPHPTAPAPTAPVVRSDAAVTTEALKAWAAEVAAHHEKRAESFEQDEHRTLGDDRKRESRALAANHRTVAAHYRAVVQLAEDHANLRQAYGAAVQRLQALGDTRVPLRAAAEGHERATPAQVAETFRSYDVTLLNSALAQWDREFGASYPDAERGQVLMAGAAIGMLRERLVEALALLDATRRERAEWEQIARTNFADFQAANDTIDTLTRERDAARGQLEAAEQHIKIIRKRNDEDVRFNEDRMRRAVLATSQGCLAAALGEPLHTVAQSGYDARTLEGDSWENGWQYVAESAAFQQRATQPTPEQVERAARALWDELEEVRWATAAKAFHKMYRDAARTALTAALSGATPHAGAGGGRRVVEGTEGKANEH